MNRSIRTKFVTGFLLIAAMFGGAVVFAWADVSDVSRLVHGMLTGPIRAIDASRTAERDFLDLRRHYLAFDTMPRERWAQRYTALHNQVGTDIEHEIAWAPSADIRDRANRGKQVLAQWDAALMAGNFNARAKMIDRLADQVEALLEQNVGAAQQMAVEDASAVMDVIRYSGVEILASGVAALVLGIGIVMMVARGVIRPIERAAAIATQISAGSFTGQIIVNGRDEPAMLLRTLSAMRDSISAQQAELTRQNIELDKLASIDALTGLFNRRKATEFAKEQFGLLDRYGGQISSIILDVDFFKKVNDTYGHEKGDEVLTHVAAVLRATTRETDVVARWGGEEFVIVLPNTPLEGAASLAEKCRQAIETHLFPEIGHQTASFGVAERGDKEAFLAMIKRADEALYLAKKGGRNQVIADDPSGATDLRAATGTAH
jgi:diguanylate cyclase (GGDEF)-like protein